MNSEYKTIEDMINKLQSLKKTTKLNFYQDFGNFCDELNYLRQSGNSYFKEGIPGKNAQGIAMIMRECLLSFKMFQTISQNENKSLSFSGIFYSITLSLSKEGEKVGFLNITWSLLY